MIWNIYYCSAPAGSFLTLSLQEATGVLQQDFSPNKRRGTGKQKARTLNFFCCFRKRKFYLEKGTPSKGIGNKIYQWTLIRKYKKEMSTLREWTLYKTLHQKQAHCPFLGAKKQIGISQIRICNKSVFVSKPKSVSKFLRRPYCSRPHHHDKSAFTPVFLNARFFQLDFSNEKSQMRNVQHFYFS